jgi:large subunit ribosomal protein L15
MPIGPFRTYTQPVNLAALEERFEAGAKVTLEALIEKGLIKNTKKDVKILGNGELTKVLSVTAHGFSKTARAKIEAAGGSVTWLRGEPVVQAKKARKARKTPVEPAPDTDTDDGAVEPAEE